MTMVLFACTHNAGRSQMAAAFFNRRADPRKARAISAGTRPGDRKHPVVLNATLGWWWADPLAALAIVPLAVREGLEGWRGECDPVQPV